MIFFWTFHFGRAQCSCFSWTVFGSCCSSSLHALPSARHSSPHCGIQHTWEFLTPSSLTQPGSAGVSSVKVGNWPTSVYPVLGSGAFSSLKTMSCFSTTLFSSCTHLLIWREWSALLEDLWSDSRRQLPSVTHTCWLTSTTWRKRKVTCSESLTVMFWLLSTLHLPCYGSGHNATCDGASQHRFCVGVDQQSTCTSVYL